jgi:hypothetical protein
MITGESGGTWLARQSDGRWALAPNDASEADASVELDQETAWRLFTKGISKQEARQAATIDGDYGLADSVFDTVSILA